MWLWTPGRVPLWLLSLGLEPWLADRRPPGSTWFTPELQRWLHASLTAAEPALRLGLGAWFWFWFWLRAWTRLCWSMLRHSPRQLRVAADVALKMSRSLIDGEGKERKERRWARVPLRIQHRWLYLEPCVNGSTQNPLSEVLTLLSSNGPTKRLWRFFPGGANENPLKEMFLKPIYITKVSSRTQPACLMRLDGCAPHCFLMLPHQNTSHVTSSREDRGPTRGGRDSTELIRLFCWSSAWIITYTQRSKLWIT